MLTRLSEFLRKHEPITKLLMRVTLLAILASVAWDFHYISLDVDDIADRVDQLQEDVSNLSNSAAEEDSPDAPTKLERTPIF